MGTKTCPYCAEEIKAEAIRCRYCHAWLSQPSAAEQGGPGDGWWRTSSWSKGGYSRLRRPTSGRMIVGVCAGLARFLNVDPTLIRVAYLALTIFTLGVPGIFLYIFLGFIIPSDSEPDLA